jgi:hypothetical protein
MCFHADSALLYGDRGCEDLKAGEGVGFRGDRAGLYGDRDDWLQEMS